MWDSKMEMFSEIDILKFVELTLLSWIFVEYEILYTEKKYFRECA
jgi:hypothetical protein